MIAKNRKIWRASYELIYQDEQAMEFFDWTAELPIKISQDPTECRDVTAKQVPG